MNDDFLIRFWGSRGSYPVPGPSTVRFGGNTTCVELQIADHPLIIDAGTGIINLGGELVRRSMEQGQKPIVATILITHTHHDHLQGFPFFAPAYIGSSVLHILGPRTFQQSLEEAISHTVMPPNFPLCLHEMPSLKIVRSISKIEQMIIHPNEGSLYVYDPFHENIEHSPDMIHVRILKSYAHPRNGVYIYRIEWRGKSVVFASDTEGYWGIDRRLVEFAQDTDILIHDAQYSEQDYIRTKQGWGHSTPQMACEIAHLSGAKQLILVHHDPSHSDEQVAALEREAQATFPNTIAAYEGLEVVLLGKHAL